MKALFNAAHRLAHGMHMVAGVLIVLMVVTVLVDVVTRFVFGATDGAIDFTFRGGVEIVSFCLLFMVLFALPYSVARGQVIVDLFTETMSERLKDILSGVYLFGFGLLGLGMTIRFSDAVGQALSTGETSQDLVVPLAYIYMAVTFATAVLALRGFLVGLEHILESGKRS
ncbi:MAG: TRAP transporter small permease [Rhodospirillum sp.]|nr:TRAP transporter small permease [Rhodospirillum sp.]MCF8488249.1 TRAP transporter small permease [Rhodospirillum sp.]MCF8501501.1 TRAP transporter small permease [Rhodospirillum sp.]